MSTDQCHYTLSVIYVCLRFLVFLQTCLVRLFTLVKNVTWNLITRSTVVDYTVVIPAGLYVVFCSLDLLLTDPIKFVSISKDYRVLLDMPKAAMLEVPI
jgi:hypothetical protein